MDETARFELPLVQPAQAQKHVTVNEAFQRLDALGQLTLISRNLSTPPGIAEQADAYAVGTNPVDEWEGQAGQIAIYLEGGWVFVRPKNGWRAWLADEGRLAVHDGGDWQAGLLARSENGATTSFEVLEIDHALGAGTTSNTTFIIPKYALVQAVTARVTTVIDGTLGSWNLGVPGAPDRYATGLGLDQGTWAIGASGSPLTYYADTALRLSAQGGDFAGGAIRLAVHLQRVLPPAV